MGDIINNGGSGGGGYSSNGGGNFKLVWGGLSGNFGDTPRRFMGAWITNTRLMGVCAMSARWKIKASEPLYQIQFFYFDWHGIGLETYESVIGDSMEEIEDAAAEIEQRIAGGLGGKRVTITERETRRLVQEFVEYNHDHGLPLPEKAYQFSFMLRPEAVMTDSERENLTKKECCRLPNSFSVINYFLMRCFARDFAGAKILMKNYVRTDIFPKLGEADLLKNTITRESDSDYHKTNDDPYFNTFMTRRSYECSSLVLADDGHYLIKTRVTLENLRVVGYEALDTLALTPWEVATMLAEHEYVTIFEFGGYEAAFDITAFPLLATAMQDETECGKLFSIYYPNNEHMERCVYFLRDDLFGLCYVLDGQVILASTSMQNIMQLEHELMHSRFCRLVKPLSRFEFSHAIMQDFINSGYDNFLEYMRDIGAGE